MLIQIATNTQPEWDGKHNKPSPWRKATRLIAADTWGYSSLSLRPRFIHPILVHLVELSFASSSSSLTYTFVPSSLDTFAVFLLDPIPSRPH